MSNYNTKIGKGLFDHLERKGLLEYGSVIPLHEIHQVIGVTDINLIDNVMDAIRTAKENDLLELAATDYVRNILLGRGKYLSKEKASYRVLLPHENAKQCERYMNSASKKLTRSIKLSRNTPAGVHPPMDDLTVRALMKKESIKKRTL